MSYFKPALGITLALTLSAFAPLPAAAQDASALSAQELEALFKKQKTRGLVLVPQAGAAAPTAAAPTAQPSAGATVTATAPTATPAAPAAETPTYVALEKNEQVNLQISFDFDSAALRADQKPKLTTLCSVMRNIDVSVFQIVGHTDSSGSASYNEKLSLLRAEEVKRHLVSDCGVSPDRLQAIGVGESSPFNEANPRADENRRVEFQALG